MASAGCRKKAGVPVLVSVAAIFRQMMPDLPMPVRMTRPLQLRSSSTAQSKRWSSRSTSARIAAASVSSTFRASFRSAIDPGALGLLHDAVDRGEAPQQRFHLVEAQRVLRVALRARRLLVDFDEHTVDAGRDAGGRERLDVFRLPRGDAV